MINFHFTIMWMKEDWVKDSGYQTALQLKVIASMEPLCHAMPIDDTLAENERFIKFKCIVQLKKKTFIHQKIKDHIYQIYHS